MSDLKIEIINTGAELLLGRVLNTHQQWLCRQLTDLGYEVSRQICVNDEASHIQAAVRESLARADLVLTTGGLGPTSDDLTRDAIAALLGRKLIFDASILARIESYFASRKRPMPPNTRVQAMVPEGARVLPNPNGTAPGLAIEAHPNPSRGSDGNPSKSWLIMLPGPPRELRPMFVDSVVPLLREQFAGSQKYICRTFKTAGMGESMVEHKIHEPLSALVKAGMQLGYCARVGEVDVRLAARGPEAERMIAEGERIVRELIGPIIFGVDDDSMEAVIVRILTERKKTLALAESCTGGFVAHRITNVPGASAAFASGLVTYSNDAKREFLGVNPQTLEEHGAVSEAVAREMAEGARNRSKTDFAIAITGIAGPSGGTSEKPVGTVFIALAQASGTSVERHQNSFDRETFKWVTSQQSLNLLRRALVCVLMLLAPWLSPQLFADDSPIQKKPPIITEVLAAAKPSDWRPLDPENTLYLELATGRVVIELAPAFAPKHVANVKALAREYYYDGLAIVRVQDNYVVQWADPDAENPLEARKIQRAHKTLPAEFDSPLDPKLPFAPLPDPDTYAAQTGFAFGFPVARDPQTGRQWLVHCYGMLGAGRDSAPDSGGGAELYVVIGQAPRHLDRNVTLLGRVVQGMELLSSLPRGTGALGFYTKAEQRVPIKSIRVASDVPVRDRSNLEILRTDTETFRNLIEARRNRREPWFQTAVGRLDVANMPVPMRAAAEVQRRETPDRQR
jgi:competence/damage-inducible protein CinA-like protein